MMLAPLFLPLALLRFERYAPCCVSASSACLPPGTFRCRTFPLLSFPCKVVDWPFNAFVGLRQRHIEPQVFARHIFHLEFPQGVANHPRENLFPGNQQNRHIAHSFLRVVAVLDLLHQGHPGTAAFILQPEVKRVIPAW